MDLADLEGAPLEGAVLLGGSNQKFMAPFGSDYYQQACKKYPLYTTGPGIVGWTTDGKTTTTTSSNLGGVSFSKIIIDEGCCLKDDNKKDMNLSTLMKRVLDKDTKTLIKAGFLTKELVLTHSGKEALESLLVEQNKEALVKLAETAIEENEGEDFE